MLGLNMSGYNIHIIFNDTLDNRNEYSSINLFTAEGTADLLMARSI
ncbi:hypothetical protein Thi970DRAFT_00721 [Thiorhodovibrio frisius]|uniref:Uncharacterized protein n=2 Tax=Thiorhodovibrio frisius TaxID=631362 RepID=H8YX94_9GAMM|nr:hypothetical protein Thi970DRAFT_00721 [Thiorhodovibrio frisius]WPL22665.1 hypothetical protein Thiofri_02835 [Thiorhodovibrio frisius]